MVRYLREGRGLHNALWAFCPAAPTERSLRGYESYYPGDAYVDVVSFDSATTAATTSRRASPRISTIGGFARAHGKVAAVAEVGRDFVGLPSAPSWFTRSLLAPLQKRSFGYVAPAGGTRPGRSSRPSPETARSLRISTRMASSEAVLMAGKHDLYRPLHVASSSSP